MANMDNNDVRNNRTDDQTNVVVEKKQNKNMRRLVMALIALVAIGAVAYIMKNANTTENLPENSAVITTEPTEPTAPVVEENNATATESTDHDAQSTPPANEPAATSTETTTETTTQAH